MANPERTEPAYAGREETWQPSRVNTGYAYVTYGLMSTRGDRPSPG